MGSLYDRTFKITTSYDDGTDEFILVKSDHLFAMAQKMEDKSPDKTKYVVPLMRQIVMMKKK